MIARAPARSVFATATLIIGLSWGAVLHAADNYMDQYRAYISSHQRGDAEGALKHGEAAWRMAETALGNHAKTATLAYNYAKLAAVFTASSESAFEAFGRALELSNSGYGDLDAVQLQVARDELAIRLDLDAKRAATNLTRALRKLAEGQQPATDITARGWATLADYLLVGEAQVESRVAAEMAVMHAESLQPVNTLVLARGLITGAIADSKLPPRKRKQALLTRAISDLDRAIALFAPQTSLDSFDPTLAKALVWRESIVAVNDTTRRRPDGPGVPRKPAPIDAFRLSKVVAKTELPDAESCPALTDYLVTTPLRYPSNAVREGLVGAVLFGFQIDGTRITRAVVLAAPGGSGFGKATEQMLSEWTLKEPYPERCVYPFYMTYAKFVLRR